jgi:hypothetical protein
VSGEQIAGHNSLRPLGEEGEGEEEEEEEEEEGEDEEEEQEEEEEGWNLVTLVQKTKSRAQF